MNTEKHDEARSGGMWAIPKAGDDSNGLSEADLDRFICEISDKVFRMKMSIPFIIFLDMVQPVSTLGSAAITMAFPFLEAIFPSETIKKWEYILLHREKIQVLAEVIESRQGKSI